MKPGSYGVHTDEARVDLERAPPYSHDQQGEKFKPEGYCRDFVFAILFLVHLVGIGVIVGYGSTIPVDCNSTSYQGFLPCETFQPVNGDWRPFFDTFKFIAILAGVGILISMAFLQLVKMFPVVMIYLGLGVNVLTFVGLAVWLAIERVYVAAVFMGIFALFFLLWIFFARSRIPFAVEILRTSVTIIQQYPGTQIASFLSILVNVAWVAIWSYAVVVSQRFGYTSNIVGTIFLLLSFYWVLEGVVASWYFMMHNMPANPTLGSFQRAITTSFGSICLGSLIVAAIKTLRTLIRMFAYARNVPICSRSSNSRKNARNVVALIFSCIALCFLRCLDNLVQYFNHYAFCQVAIYGKTYIQAAKSTWNLFLNNGFAAIVNDNIIDGVLWMGILAGGILTGATGFLLAYFNVLFPSLQMTPIAGLGIGFVIGFILLILAMQVVDSSVACLFVCFAEDKHRLQAVNPELCQRLMETYYNIAV